MFSTRRLLVLTVSSVLATFSSAQESTTADQAFPLSSALSQSVSPDSLQKLSGLVQGFVDDGDVVGAELMVIKNGRTILHEGFGLKDKEQATPMGTGNVFCVRSMTKPLIGTSILMLAGDKQLKLNDPVAKYLPEFGGEDKCDITIEQLLTHTSGLTMSSILAMDLTTLEGIRSVAQLGAKTDLEFEPGTAFNYSDQGTDTLTALLEVASGIPAEDFVRTRILEPLGMQDSACVMSEGHPLRERGCCKYSGSRGNWTRFWGPDEAPLFPFFLGSQGLYSSLEDYARFLDLWLNKGRLGGERLLRASYVRKALRPNPFPFPGSTGMPGLKPGYGFLMQLWASQIEGEEQAKHKVQVFGHTGSDGTHAWAFPEQQAMVLYFTQSRGTTTGLRVEEALGELFLGVPFDPNQLAPPFEPFLGYYAEDAFSRYQAIIRDGEDLALETPGKRIRQLAYAGEDDWKFRDKPSVVLTFDRSEAGEVTGFHIGEHAEFRFEPAADLPTAREVAGRVARTHRIDLLDEAGPLRMSSTLRIEKLDITGEQHSLVAWPDKLRVDSSVNGNSELAAIDGDTVWYASSKEPRAILDGARAQDIRQTSLLSVFGDWRRSYPELQVLQHIQKGTQNILIVRTGGTDAVALTLYVDWTSGRLKRLDKVSEISGMGRIGQQITFEDFRDVGGMVLPFQSTIRIANRLIGSIVTTVDDVELGVEVAAGTWSLQDDGPTLEERLAKLEHSLEAARQAAHVPGMSIAIVREDEVVYAHGFGMADLASELPAEADTIYAIGSTTKAFTSALVGMQVDEGNAGWDDPVTRHLPYFDLQVRSDDPEAQCTLRDLLSHRHGFARMGILVIGGQATREEILHTAAGAEPWDGFREAFHYCNVTYLAAGMAAGAAAKSTWDEMMVERIFHPLSMDSTSISLSETQLDPRLALGYKWNEALEQHEREPMLDLHSIGPAGAVNSNVLDMAQWLRLQLGEGLVDGQRLIGREQLLETWQPQITMGDGDSYGMGWMLRERDGLKLVEHGGNIDGFTAEVAFIPELDLGYVLLMNLSATPLRMASIELVFDALLDEGVAQEEQEEIASDSDEFSLEDFAGNYIANFASFEDELFEILIQDEALVLDIPSQRRFELKQPDAQGKWGFVMTDQIAVSFSRDGHGAVESLTMHQSGFSFEVPRQGLETEPEVPLEQLEKYLGTYASQRSSSDVQISIHAGGLFFAKGNDRMPLAAPDSKGMAPMRARPEFVIEFVTDAEGAVESFILHAGPKNAVFTKRSGAPASDLPSLEELLLLRNTEARIAALHAAGGTKTTGEVWVAQAGVRGRLTIYTDGPERFASHMDFGKYGRVDAVVREKEAWSYIPLRGRKVLAGEELAQAMLEHPGAVEGDWNEYFDGIEVIRNDTLNERPVHVLRLTKQGLPSRTYWIDAENGDLLRTKQITVGGPMQIPVTTTYSDFEVLGGIRVARRAELSNPASGRSVLTFEATETGLTLDRETFTLKELDPSPERRE